MSGVVIAESHDGGQIEVDTRTNALNGQRHVVIEASERAMGYAVLHLTAAETDELIAALQAARASFGAEQ